MDVSFSRLSTNGVLVKDISEREILFQKFRRMRCFAPRFQLVVAPSQQRVRRSQRSRQSDTCRQSSQFGHGSNRGSNSDHHFPVFVQLSDNSKIMPIQLPSSWKHCTGFCNPQYRADNLDGPCVALRVRSQASAQPSHVTGQPTHMTAVCFAVMRVASSKCERSLTQVAVKYR